MTTVQEIELKISSLTTQFVKNSLEIDKLQNKNYNIKEALKILERELEQLKIKE